MLFLIQNYAIFDYLHVREEDYLNLLKNAKENDYPLPKRPLIKHEPIDTAILCTLLNRKHRKKFQYVSKYRQRIQDAVDNVEDIRIYRREDASHGLRSW